MRSRRGYRHLSVADRQQRSARAASLIPGLTSGVERLAQAREREQRAIEEAAAAEAADAARDAGAVATLPVTDPDADPGTTPPVTDPDVDPTVDPDAGDPATNPTTDPDAAGSATDPAVNPNAGDPGANPTIADASMDEPAEASAEADEPRPVDADLLPTTLAHLAQTARLYRTAALTFACDETVILSMFSSAGNLRRRAAWELEYIYTFEEPPPDAPDDAFRRLRDYRTRRDAGFEPGAAADEVSLADLDLPAVTVRAYSWAFLFQEGLQPHYRFELVGTQRALQREALIVAFEPVPPEVEGFNDWFGRAWVDAETYQVLRIEALPAGDYWELDAVEHDRVRLEVPRDGRVIVRLEAAFDVEERGVRLPSRVALTGEDYSMRALAFGIPGGNISSSMPEWRMRGRVAFRIEQLYDNYRFFNVEVR